LFNALISIAESKCRFTYSFCFSGEAVDAFGILEYDQRTDDFNVIATSQEHEVKSWGNNLPSEGYVLSRILRRGTSAFLGPENSLGLRLFNWATDVLAGETITDQIQRSWDYNDWCEKTKKKTSPKKTRSDISQNWRELCSRHIHVSKDSVSIKMLHLN
jgi:hypothetical protein